MTHRHDPIDPFDTTPTTGETTVTQHDRFIARVNDAIGHEPLVEADPTPPPGLPRPTMDDRPDGTTVLRSKPSASIEITVTEFPHFTATTVRGPRFSTTTFEHHDCGVWTETSLHGMDDDTNTKWTGPNGITHTVRTYAEVTPS
jgi:hypothetical protein